MQTVSTLLQILFLWASLAGNCHQRLKLSRAPWNFGKINRQVNSLALGKHIWRLCVWVSVKAQRTVTVPASDSTELGPQIGQSCDHRAQVSYCNLSREQSHFKSNSSDTASVFGWGTKFCPPSCLLFLFRMSMFSLQHRCFSWCLLSDKSSRHFKLSLLWAWQVSCSGSYWKPWL